MKTFGQLCEVGMLVSFFAGYIGFAAVFMFGILLALVLLTSTEREGSEG